MAGRVGFTPYPTLLRKPLRPFGVLRLLVSFVLIAVQGGVRLKCRDSIHDSMEDRSVDISPMQGTIREGLGALRG